MGWEKQGLPKSWRCFFCKDIIKGFFTWLTTFGQREGKLSRSNIVYINKIRWRIAPLQCSERTGNQWRRLLREIYFRVQNLQHMTFWWLAWTLYQQTIGFSWSLGLIALRSLHHMITKLRDMSSEARAKHTLFFLHCFICYTIPWNFFHFSPDRFWRTRERLSMNPGRSLLNMCRFLLG